MLRKRGVWGSGRAIPRQAPRKCQSLVDLAATSEKGRFRAIANDSDQIGKHLTTGRLLRDANCESLLKIQDYSIQVGLGIQQPAERILDKLCGFVESIRGDRACVILRGPDGTEFEGDCDAQELLASGIEEQQPLICLTVRLPDGTVEVRFEPAAARKRTPAEVAALSDGLDFLDDDALDSNE